MASSTPTKSPAARITALLAAAIYIPGLIQKLSGAPESVWLFEQTGMGDLGRYGSAAAEIVAILLLIQPRYRQLGALLSIGVMVGAIGSHLGTDLGVAPVFPGESEGDPTLFAMAVAELVLSAVTLFLVRQSKS
ncbi:MAG: DoxX family protein [Planctomycetota bacterium]